MNLVLTVMFFGGFVLGILVGGLTVAVVMTETKPGRTHEARSQRAIQRKDP